MSKVLVYGNRKMDALIIDASIPEKESVAFLKLFNYLDEEWQVYGSVDSIMHKDLYVKAKSGDSAAAKKLLLLRRNYEYETWQENELIDPLTEDIG